MAKSPSQTICNIIQVCLRPNLESDSKAKRLLGTQTSLVWFELGINQIEADFTHSLPNRRAVHRGLHPPNRPRQGIGTWTCGSRFSTPTQLEVLYLKSKPQNPPQSHRRSTEPVAIQNCAPSACPDAWVKVNRGDTQYCTNLPPPPHKPPATGPGPGPKSASPAGIIRIELERKPQVTRRLPRGSLRDLVEWVGGKLSLVEWGGWGDARAAARR